MKAIVTVILALGLVGAAGLHGPLRASELSVSSKSRAGLSSHQLKVLDGRASEQYSASTRLRPTLQIPRYVGRYDGPHLETARAAARRHDLPEDLFLRLVQRESGWNPEALSVKGAIGLAQLMPQTARELGVDPHDPRQNLEGGARYLRAQFLRFGDWRLALAAYNAGPEAVTRHAGVPPFAETQGYVRAILGQ